MHLGAWVVFSWPAVGTLNPYTSWEERAVTVPLAIAAFVVARSRSRPQADEAPRPPVVPAPVAH